MQMMQMREELEMLKEAPSKAQKDGVPRSGSNGNSVCSYMVCSGAYRIIMDYVKIEICFMLYATGNAMFSM